MSRGVGALLQTLTIAGAVTAQVTTPVVLDKVPKALTIQAKFLYGAGGTTAKFWLQTSLDQGATWIDIACFSFTTSAATKISALSSAVALAAATVGTDGTLTGDTIVNGLLGDQYRIKYTTTGTYTGATSIDIRGLSA